MTKNKLNLEIRSLSLIYSDNHGPLKGPPHFMFDCRSVTNPGRIDIYKQKTGLDEGVAQFLTDDETAQEFSVQLKALIEPSIESALTRNFKNYKIWFGCTGGQHRSVYFAQLVASWYQDKSSIIVDIEHLDINSFYAKNKK